MSLAASCPRCASPMSEEQAGWRCLDHGAITPMWRPAVADYESLAEHLRHTSGIPTLLPWPLAPGWVVSDFGCVAEPDREARASMISTSGPSELDGVVEITVVTEEPGVGLGARCAGVDRTDPGADISEGPPQAKVRLDGRPTALWSVSTSSSDGAFDRSVFAGEAMGRWLWLVLRPASAALLLNDELTLCDISGFGPSLVDVPFGGNPPPW